MYRFTCNGTAGKPECVGWEKKNTVGGGQHSRLGCMLVMRVRLWRTRHQVRREMLRYQARTVRKLLMEAAEEQQTAR